MKIINLANVYYKIASDDYLYHITYYKNLSSIASDGLLFGFGSSMGQGGNLSHSSGKIFLTEKSGINFWYDRAEQHAENLSDNIYDEGFVPVVLRIDIGDAENEIDEVGTVDANAEAFIIKESIEPDYIEIWNGNSWVDIQDYHSIDTMQALTTEEDDGETLYYFKEYDNKLIP